MKKKQPKEDEHFSVTGSIFKTIDRINDSMDAIAGRDKKVKK